MVDRIVSYDEEGCGSVHCISLTPVSFEIWDVAADDCILYNDES